MSNRTPKPTEHAPAASSSRDIDRESRRVVREQLLTNLLVEAGAGSGKTQMLAERMAAGVAAGVYDVSRMAAVTFTRKAASELRGRFHLALENQRREVDRIPDAGERALARQRIEAALGNLERFFAGTIHSFCARLLHERPVEAGVSPGFTELDEAQDLELRKRIWRDFVTSMRTAGDPDMMALLDAGVSPKQLDAAFATICLNEDVEFPAGEVEPPDPANAWIALGKFWKELQKHLPSQIDPETTCPIQAAALNFRGQLSVSKNRLDRPSVMALLLGMWNCESKITQYQWADSTAEKRRLRDLINPLHEAFLTGTVTPYLSQWRQYVYRLSVSLLMRARDHAARERRRLNDLNYGDLLILTARVLRKNAAVRYSLQQKYRHLFVDEFQDTDPVQAEIVFLLAGDEADLDRPAISAAAGAEADWRTIPVRRGALFVVGDPKQSIYRFRRADIDIYNIVRDRFSDAAVGRVLPLTMNFRSVPALCNWANEVFKTRFPQEPTTHSPRFAALDASEDDKAPGGVFTLTHTCERGEVHEQDAGKIAAYIRAEVDAGRRTFSDFLILTRKKRNLVRYATALEKLNIPIEVSGAGAFGDSKEVAGLVALLQALADPQDTVALIAVLRGPLFGIRDPELFAFRQSGGWFSIFADTKDANDQPESNRGSASTSTSGGSVRAALAALRQYYRWTRVLPAAAALERILEHTGYLALAATTPGGVEAGDLLHAVDRVRQVVEEGGSLANAAEALGEDSEDSNEVESLPLEPGRMVVVRVMNLHKAKGLEADVVFLADPNGGFQPRVDAHIERNGAKSLGWFKVEQKSEGKSWGGKLLGEHADWALHEATELPYLQAEEDRLLYVAATRARQMLVVSRWTGNHSSKAWGVLNAFLTKAQELAVPQSVAVGSIEPLDCSNEAHVAAAAARAVSHDQARQASWSITSVTADAKHVVRTMRAMDAAADDPTKVVSPDTPTHRADAGMAWGTLIHGLLEHAMRHESATREDLRRLAVWLTVDEPRLRAVVDHAVETVERVAQAEFWRVAKAGKHLEEAPFTVTQGKVVTNGVIDLLFKTAEGWQIRDYKTDLALTQEAYERQLNTYRSALDDLGCEVADAELVHVRNSK
jgi:ATP-dependent helicase/nuclease subunit A